MNVGVSAQGDSGVIPSGCCFQMPLAFLFQLFPCHSLISIKKAKIHNNYIICDETFLLHLCAMCNR